MDLMLRKIKLWKMVTVIRLMLSSSEAMLGHIDIDGLEEDKGDTYRFWF